VTSGGTSVAGPYAAIPSSFTGASLRIGSWFQTYPRRARLLTAIAVLVGATHLVWRIIDTSAGVNA